MVNQVMMIGRIVKDPEVKELESGNKVSNITLAVPRSFKNADGEYETDFVDCSLWGAVAERTAEYCKKGDLIAIKGRIQTKMIENDGEKKKHTEVVAERISFLASHPKEKDKEESEEEMEM